ncbi:hypothetical protein FXO38_15913 [Capsicum annuum]|nr:hypothetical protein FXO38_15913 [Capsicum annuum]
MHEFYGTLHLTPKENNCPVQIWGLMQLRHLKLQRCYLPDCPSGSVDKGRHMGFSNLQTISYLSSHCCMKEVIMGIQNVKELGISEGNRMDSNGLLNNLVHLQQLETLNLTFCSSRLLPATELRNLEVLKLMISACVGNEWCPNVRGFTRLKVLIIEQIQQEQEDIGNKPVDVRISNPHIVSDTSDSPTSAPQNPSPPTTQ